MMAQKAEARQAWHTAKGTIIRSGIKACLARPAYEVASTA